MVNSEQLKIEIITPSIGAVIHDFDLSQPLTSDQKHALEQALYKHHVLFFHNQNLTPEQQRDFALSFGPIHVHPIYTYAGPHPEVTVLEYGEKINPDQKPRADEWHTDVSWAANPPIMGMLYAKVIPKQGGGDTLWANMADIYKYEVSDYMKQTLCGLTAEHSFVGFKAPSNPSATEKEKYMKAIEDNPPVSHPVIREHSHTGEKYLYVNGNFTTKINELNRDESKLLLQHLFSLVNRRPDFVCRWKWTENDFCIWDERTTQHYAAPDYWPQHRRMHRCAVTE